MIFKRLAAALCFIAVLSSLFITPVFAADVSAIDLSENRTRFENADIGAQGIIRVFAIDSDGGRTEVTGGDISYQSSSAGICSIDQSGNYTINGKGIAIVTAEYQGVSKSMIINCGGETYESVDHDTYTNYNTKNSQNITLGTDEFRGKSDVLYWAKPLNFSLKNYAGKNSYILSAWLYDSMDFTKDVFKFGARAARSERLIYGAYSAGNTSCGNFVTPVKNQYVNVRKAREKGWHQFFEIVTIEDGISHVIMFYDGEKVSEYDMDAELIPYYNDMSENFFQELYLSEFSVASFEFVKSNINSSNIFENPGEAIELQFSKNIDTESFSADSVCLEDGIQKIEVKAAAADNKLVISPDYPLSFDADYKLTISGELMSESDYFSPKSKLGNELVIDFKTGKRAYYAENHTAELETAVSASAELGGSIPADEGYIIAVQFDAEGVAGKIDASKLPDAISEADKNSGTCTLESYVLSSICADVPEVISVQTAGDVYERKQIEPSGASDKSFANVVYDTDNGYVEIRGFSASGRANLPVLVRVVNPKQDYTDASCENINDVYNRIETVYTDSGGKFSYAFILGGEPGTYSVLINIPFEDKVFRKDMRYASKTEVYDAIDKIYKASEGELTEIFEKYRDVLDLYYEKYDSSKYQKLILRLLRSYGEKQTFKEFEAAFTDAAELVNALESEEAGKLIEENKTKWQIDNVSTTKIYLDAGGAMQKKIADETLLTGFGSVKEFAQVFSACTAMNTLRGIKNSGEIYSLLSSMNDVFKIDFSVYSKLSGANKDKTLDEFADKLREIKSVSEVKREFESIAVKVNKSSPAQSGGGNSSGGLSGGSGGGLTGKFTGKFEIPADVSTQMNVPKWVEEENALKQKKVFSDLEGAEWAEESIRELYNLGVISGRTEDLFMPNDYVTREELVKMLVTAMNIEGTKDEVNQFADFDSSAWYAPYVNAAYAKGIVQGKGGNALGIGEYITREEICTIADRAAEQAGIFLDDEYTIQPFLDENDISVWAVQPVLKMRESFIVSGVGGNYFKPKDLVTRAQAAKIIYGIIAFAAI